MCESWWWCCDVVAVSAVRGHVPPLPSDPHSQHTAAAITSRRFVDSSRSHGGDDAEDDEPPGLDAEHAHTRQQGGHGAQPRGEAAAGARQEGGDGARREGEETEVVC